MKLSFDETLKVPSSEILKDVSFRWNHEVTDSRAEGSVDVTTNGASIVSYTSKVSDSKIVIVLILYSQTFRLGKFNGTYLLVHFFMQTISRCKCEFM